MLKYLLMVISINIASAVDLCNVEILINSSVTSFENPECGFIMDRSLIIVKK